MLRVFTQRVGWLPERSGFLPWVSPRAWRIFPRYHGLSGVVCGDLLHFVGNTQSLAALWKAVKIRRRAKPRRREGKTHALLVYCLFSGNKGKKIPPKLVGLEITKKDLWSFSQINGLILVGADFQCLVFSLPFQSSELGPQPSLAEGISTFRSFSVLKQTPIKQNIDVYSLA